MAIFSRNELKNASYSENEINDIGNIRYVSANENKWKSNTPFLEWMKNVLIEERKKHLIPDGDWDVSTYRDFIKARKKLMIENVSKAIPSTCEEE